MSRRPLPAAAPAMSAAMPAAALPGTLPGGPAAAPPPPTSVLRPVLLLALTCLLFWAGFGSWAALAPLQSAVVASGSLEVEGELPSVQHLEGGLIREVRVREGEAVEKGQVLAVLADTRSGAQDRILMNQLAGALAEDGRLAAELAGEGRFIPSAELALLLRENPDFADLLETQRDLFRSNNEMWQGQADILSGRLADLDTQRTGILTRQQSLNGRLALLREELDNMARLQESGLITKARYNGLQQNEIALTGDISVLDSQLDSVRQRMAEVESRILQLRRDRAARLTAERQAVREEIFDLRQRLLANRDVRDRSLIRAPAAGRVLGLAFTAAGEVVQDGEELMKIVPDGAGYIVEAQIRPEDIDQVAEGQDARVRLTAYNFRTTPPVEGAVTHVSADSFRDPQTGASFYRVDVRISEAALAALPEVHVQPGMPAQIMIATGEQTLATYLLSPVLGGLETALRESD